MDTGEVLLFPSGALVHEHQPNTSSFFFSQSLSYCFFILSFLSSPWFDVRASTSSWARKSY